MNTILYLTMFSYANNNISFEIAANQKENCIITLTDAKGDIIKMSEINLSTGTNKIILGEMKFLPKGYYMINVRTSSQVYLFSAKIYREENNDLKEIFLVSDLLD